jgi:hypothetical protein
MTMVKNMGRETINFRLKSGESDSLAAGEEKDLDVNLESPINQGRLHAGLIKTREEEHRSRTPKARSRKSAAKGSSSEGEEA